MNWKNEMIDFSIYAHKRYDEKKKTRKSVILGNRIKPILREKKRESNEETR